MALYEYRCGRHGPFDVSRPLGSASESEACPVCAEVSRRVFSVPMLATSSPRPLMAALEHEEKTRYEPDLVTSLPKSGNRKATPMAPLTPQLAKLPRP
jgi:putative FmdB family regulatory protein